MKPARFILSLVGVALFLALGTVLIFSAIAQSSGTPLPGWETKAGIVLGLVPCIALVMRAALLLADNRREKR